MIGSGLHNAPAFNDGSGKQAAITEQQMIMKELSDGSPEAEADVLALAGELPR